MTHHALIFSCRGELFQRGAGAHRIATYLRTHGWDVEVIDFAAHWALEQLQELVKSRTTSNTVFFGFSTFFNYWTDNLSNFTKWLKEKYPTVPTVLGGQSVALTPAKNIDYWVDSFGEVAMLELAKSLIGNSPVGIKYDMSHFGKKKLIKAIHSYPAYPMESYANILERRDFLQPYEWLTTEFSRGCIFNCAFCNFPILGVKDDYSRSKEDFEREMKHNYDEYGISNYYVADETFNDSVEKIQKFAEVVDEKLSFQPYFSGFMRADLLAIKRNSWDPLIRLGMGAHYYGVETMNHKSAKVVGKGMNPEKLKKGLLDIKEYFKSKMFYRGTISLIIGLPYESPDTIKQTEDWLDANWQDQGLIAFPLDVDDVTDMKENKYTNVSDFSKNLVKYGIREMNVEKQEWGDLDYYYNWRDGNWYEDTFMWEHDSMNIVQAREISHRLQNKQITSYTLTNWSLAQPSLMQQRNLPLSEIEHWTPADLQGRNRTDIIRNFVDRYIQSKLNYRP